MANATGDVVIASTTPDASASTSLSSTAPPPQTVPMRTDHDRQEYYFLPSAHVPRSRPHVSQNVISDFGLDEVHERVRRINPQTGEKINKIRKSYQGIAKNYRLSGKISEAVKPGEWVNVEGKSKEQPGILDYNDESWKATRTGATVVSEESANDLLAKLDQALQIAPGAVPNREYWKKMTADDTAKPKASAVAGIRGAIPVAGKVSAAPSPKLGALHRSQRAGAKRSYDDSSFAGYEDTFEDTAGSDLGSMRKKARKDIPIAQTLNQGSSYNVGLMAGGARQR